MSREEILEKVNLIFRENFNDDSLVITDDTTAEDIPAWDSLEHMNLVNAIEEEFSIEFTMKEVTGMQTVGEMVGIIQERMSV